MRSDRTSGFRCARAIVLAAGLSLAWTSLAVAQTVVTWTGAGGNTNWSNPLNWSPQVVPMNGGGVEYAVIIPSGVTVLINAGVPSSIAVQSIALAPGATLTVTAARTVTVASDAGLMGRVNVLGNCSFVTVPPSGSVPGTLNQTVFSIDGLASFRSAASAYSAIGAGTRTIFATNGAGALLNLSSLTSLVLGDAAATVTQTVRSAGGLIDLSNVQSVAPTGSSRAVLVAETGGSINLSSMQVARNVDFLQNGAGALTTGALRSMDGSTLSVYSGVFDAHQVTSYSSGTLVNAALIAVNGVGSRVNLSGLTSMSLGLGAFSLTASDRGVLDVSSLTTISRTLNTVMNFEVRGGASLLAGSVETLASTSGGASISLRSGDPNSVLDFSRVVAVSSGGNLTINAFDGGQIDLSRATNINNARIAIQNGNLQIGSLRSLDDSRISVSSGVFLAPATVTDYTVNTTTAGPFIFESTGGLLSMPGLRTIRYGAITGATWVVRATGPSAIIDFSALTSFISLSTATLNVSAISGGTLRLGALTSLPGRASLGASGAQSVVEVPSLVSLDAAGEQGISAGGGATMTLPALTIGTSGPNLGIGAGGAGSVLNLPVLVSLGAGGARRVLTELGGTLNVPVLTSLSDTTIQMADPTSRLNAPLVTSIDRSTVTLWRGATLNLLGVNAITASPSAGGVFLSVTDAGTLLNLANLSSMRLGIVNSNIGNHVVATSGTIDLSRLATITKIGTGNHSVRAELGGRILLGSLATVPTGFSATAVGTGSEIDMSGFTAPTTATSVIFVANGGLIKVRELRITNSVNYLVATVAGAVGRVSVNGSLINQSTQVTQFSAATGILSFAGGISATFEAAGLDLGLAVAPESNFGNAGVGQLRIGDGTSGSTITLVDAFNNGQRGPSGHEVLYMYGIGTGASAENGLVLQNGSRLVIENSVGAFARINGLMTNLRSLIPAGQTQVAFSGGFIVVPSPSAAVALLGVGVFAQWHRTRGRGSGRFGA